MNRTALIAIVVAAVVIVIGGVWIAIAVFSAPAAPSTATTSPAFPNPPVVVPVTGNGQSGTPAASTSTVTPVDGGQPIVTSDFDNGPSVIHNAYSTPGYDILVGTDDPSASNPPYEIDYSAKDQSFGITLYKEPLGQYRLAAQQDLMQRLGISEADMCRLNYVLATGPGVNDTYAGKNLGFSFCPGAVALP